MADITPRTSTELFGHSDAEATLRRDFASGRLAHGWIIAGPKGIGKATLAYRFARFLLAGGQGEVSSDHAVFRRVAAESHTDLLVIEPLYDEKKEEFAREISVEQARAIGEFLALTPAEGDWRVVIVDGADALNVNAANAILKILEEPPAQAVLLMVAHNPGRLLPTIRSRCHLLKLKPLNEDDFAAVLHHIAPGAENLPALAQLSSHAPGVAIDMQEQEALELYAQVLALAGSLPAIDALALHGFADRINGRVHAQWQMLTRLILSLLERITLTAAGAPVEPISPEEARALSRLAALHPAAVWAARWQEAMEQFSLADARHLDYKQVIIAFFHSLSGREPFHIGLAA